MMELQSVRSQEILREVDERTADTQTAQVAQVAQSAFIEANTIPMTYSDIKLKHIIPSYSKDNETVISHTDFMDCMAEVIQKHFQRETILEPKIRLSHPISGRIPEAKGKPAKELEDWEKTLYYERMAFLFELPEICEEIQGNRLNLSIGGVKSYTLDNLTGKKGYEHFKIFIGFQNKVCTNLCIWSDGEIETIKAINAKQLQVQILQMVQQYDAVKHLNMLEVLPQYQLKESQFAHLLGRARMYQHLPNAKKKEIPELKLVDTQVSAVAREYFNDKSFQKESDGSINLWKLYNLFTGANKSSYIDRFLDRGQNAFEFVGSIREALEHQAEHWYLN